MVLRTQHLSRIQIGFGIAYSFFTVSQMLDSAFGNKHNMQVSFHSVTLQMTFSQVVPLQQLSSLLFFPSLLYLSASEQCAIQLAFCYFVSFTFQFWHYVCCFILFFFLVLSSCISANTTTFDSISIARLTFNYQCTQFTYVDSPCYSIESVISRKSFCNKFYVVQFVQYLNV